MDHQFKSSREARDFAVETLSKANRMAGFSHRNDGAAAAAKREERDLRRAARLALDTAIQLEREGK